MAIKGRAVLQALWPKPPPFVWIGPDTHIHTLVMHIEAVTHIHMDIKENKSTAPWTRSDQSAIMAGLIIMCCFCLFK